MKFAQLSKEYMFIDLVDRVLSLFNRSYREGCFDVADTALIICLDFKHLQYLSGTNNQVH
jgi:hypothetical protein